MEKMTKKEMFTQIMNHLTDENEIAFLEHEIELLSKKRKGNEQLHALNADLAEFVLGYLKENNLSQVRASELVNSRTEIGSTSKATSILNILCNDGKMERVVDKRITYYKIL